MSVYVGFKIGKAKERKAYVSEYYCGGCGWPVSDHDSYCPECGGAFRKEDATERTCHVKQAYFHDCSDLDDLMEGIAFSPEDTVACICDSCGMDWRFDRGIHPNYCPFCGAKVVE